MQIHFVYATSGIVGLIGLCIVWLLFNRIRSLKVDNARAAHIAKAIQTGAMTFLAEEYRVIAIVVAVLAVLLTYFGNMFAALSFLIGAALSLMTGFIGMCAATLANVRTTLAAQRSERAAFMVAFLGGGVMGFSVASIGLLGLGGLLYLSVGRPDFELLITSFGLGASLVAFFARVGGGIYTKSADIGADLVGKLEVGIPEDDPRNPAVIADNVGDCVGDTAGMGADIYESYVTSIVSTIILATTHYPNDFIYLTFPLMVAAFGLIGSIIGLFSNLVIRASSAALLRNATYVAVVFYLLTSYAYINTMGIDMSLFYSLLVGCATGIIVGLVTEYYTSSSPIKKLAQISQSGAATNIIYGLSIGMESVVVPVIMLGLGVWVAYIYGGGLFGVSLAAVSMLATVGITMTVDAYGPIADNAGGIAEMADIPVRKITDKLDALGNTTAAIGKGFAIGSALLAALGIFAAYAEKAQLLKLDLLNPVVLIGMFIGATMPFLISALTMRSVGNAALKMVFEVRRQFKDIPGLLEGKAEPDYKRCIAISTHASLREMILPGLLTVIVPVLVKFLFGSYALGGFLAGATLVGVLLALMMTTGGGAWDNAKKYVEAGHFGGKKSAAHQAAIVGDTVGDPFKDTSGPALNILIKLMSMVALLLVSL
ncbi:MAG: sodium-translocating pyrophosphatase [Candidatus Babeliaceae bacterium]